MLYNNENISISLIEVKRVKWKGGFFNIKSRPYCALVYRLSGSGSFKIGNENIISNSGDVFFMPQGLSYEADYTDGEIIVFHFTMNEHSNAAENYSTDNSQELYKLFMKAEFTWSAQASGFKNRALSLFYEIMAVLCESESTEQFPDAIRTALSFLHSRFAAPELSIPDICRHCDMGETAFRESFKRVIGKTPLEYLTELRLEHAKELILIGKTVELAALESGFSDPKYFSRVVKKKFGCTPKELVGYGR